MERKACFILDAGNLVRQGNVGPKADSPNLTTSGQELFGSGRRGLHVETTQSMVMIILESVISGLTSFFLIILSTANL